jgi:sortase A
MHAARALARAERDGAAPGTEFRFATARPGERRKRRVPRLAGMLLALSGIFVAIGAWHAADAAYLHAKAWLGQQLLLDAWRKSGPVSGAVKPWPWADTHPVARLVVPAHRIELLVLAGANGRTLAWGPGHVESTASPGMAGNAVVTAHRDTHFAFLRDLVAGDRIVVETAARSTRSYRVERTLIADHRELLLPADHRATTLSLVTCYPFDAIDPRTPLRYAVIARGE